jgi:hypothetical protein
VVQLNKTRLQQWPDGEAEVLRDIVPDGVASNPPVIHVVKNVGDLPLRGIVIELKPERPSRYRDCPPMTGTVPDDKTCPLSHFLQTQRRRCHL